MISLWLLCALLIIAVSAYFIVRFKHVKAVTQKITESEQLSISIASLFDADTKINENTNKSYPNFSKIIENLSLLKSLETKETNNNSNKSNNNYYDSNNNDENNNNNKYNNKREVLFKKVAQAGMIIPPAGDAILASIPQLEAFQKIDYHVLDALKQSSSDSMQAYLNKFENLKEYVSQYLLDGNLGDVIRLKGYVAEQFAAEYFTSAGHQVEFPDNPTNPGYDLLVDDKALQVKQGISGSIVSEHFEKYPDIPVITGTDLAGHFPDHINLMGIPQLDHANIDQVTNNTLEGVHDIGSIGLHVPYITLAFSGLRELDLLRKGVTNMETSLKHIMLDAAGTSGGMLVGAKAGAMLGSPLGPGGILFGALAGGIGGAIFGRSITNNIKRKALEEAFAAYKDELQRSNMLCENEKQKLMEFAGQQSKMFDLKLRTEEQDYNNRLKTLMDNSKQKIIKSVSCFFKTVSIGLERSREDLNQKCINVKKTYNKNKSIKLLLDLFWPSYEKIFIHHLLGCLSNEIKKLNKRIKYYQTLAPKKFINENTLKEIFSELYDFIKTSPQFIDAELQKKINNFINHCNYLYMEIQNNGKILNTSFQKTSTTHLQQFLHKVSIQGNQFAQFVIKQHQTVKGFYEKVIIEAKKLGIKLQGQS